MSKQPPEKVKQDARRKRQRFTEKFKAQAVQMLLDGHSAGSICGRLGLSSPNVLYRWKREAIRQGGVAAVGLEGRVRELEGAMLGPEVIVCRSCSG